MHRLLKDRRGVSEVMVSACMIFIMFMLAAMLMQIIGYAISKLAVNAAAFTAARAAVKTETPYETAEAVAEEYGRMFLRDWEENMEVVLHAPDGINPGSLITVEITYEVPKFFNIFSPPPARGISSQVMEELP
jgi:Flp pilus assembly protein TadG